MWPMDLLFVYYPLGVGLKLLNEQDKDIFYYLYLLNNPSKIHIFLIFFSSYNSFSTAMPVGQFIGPKPFSSSFRSFSYSESYIYIFGLVYTTYVLYFREYSLMWFISQTSQIWLKILKKDKSYQLNKSVLFVYCVKLTFLRASWVDFFG